MSRILFTFIFIIVANIVAAQDTLVYVTNELQAVQITKIDKEAREITYQLGGESASIGFSALLRYKYQGTWVQIEAGNNKSHGDEKTGLFTKLGTYRYGKWAISYNLASPFLSVLSVVNKNNRTFFSNNALISIEPEYFISDKFSLKFPVYLGLPNFKLPITETIDRQNVPTTAVDEGGLLYKSTLYWRYQIELDNAVLPIIDGKYENEDAPEHGRRLLAQIGVHPKWFPYGQSKNALFIGQGLDLGIGDMYAIDYFHTWETSNGSSVEDWVWTEERIELRTDNTLFFRYEATVGVSFNFGNALNLSIETGYSTPMKNSGKDGDRVYRRIFKSGAYEQIHAEVYNEDKGSWGRIINRLHLVYRFGGERRELDQ